MEKKRDDETCSLPNSTENTVELHGDEDEDETLSLSDLPLIHKNEETRDRNEIQIQEDFDFCYLSKQPEMCAADELFFQGQILPMRSVTRSESMDHLHHSGPAGLISSRSSSISSHQSSSSGSSSGGPPKSRAKLPPARNQFHSHPSPSPRIHFPSKKPHNCPKRPSSSVWDVFRLGILTPPPDIAFLDLKPRANCRNFGSRNSTDSNSSSIISSSSTNPNNYYISDLVKKKSRSLLGGCKCSADAVDTVTTTTRGAMIKRSASAIELLEAEKLLQVKKQSTKKHVSHHRTFEWLKQLSLEDDRGCG